MHIARETAHGLHSVSKYGIICLRIGSETAWLPTNTRVCIPEQHHIIPFFPTIPQRTQILLYWHTLTHFSTQYIPITYEVHQNIFKTHYTKGLHRVILRVCQKNLANYTKKPLLPSLQG